MREIDYKNEDKFKSIYDENFDMVYRIGLLYLKNKEEAEDLVQEVFIKLLNTNKEFMSLEHIKAWLIRVSKNLSKDKLKSFWKSKRVDLSKLPELEDEAEDPDLDYVLEELLSLPDKYKMVLYLFYYEDYSVKEISKILKRKESTIQTQLSRARDILEEKLRERLYE